MRNLGISIVLITALGWCGSCSDDDFQTNSDIGGYTDITVDTAIIPDRDNLPDGYGPLYSCKNPGQACNAHDKCAINPICDKDGKCRPESVMNCNDNLACTTDTCAGLGVCENTPKAGACKLLVRVPKGTTCAALKGDAGVQMDAGVANDAGVSPTTMESISCCFSAEDRNPADPCMKCDPPGDAGGTSSKKWTPANGGHCDDGDPCTKSDYCQSGTCKGTSFASLCSDGIACTTDKCDGKGGCLGNTLKTGYCLINKVCYKDGAPHPNGSCKACVSSKNTADWTVVTNTCSIGGKCYAKGTKNSGGCAECDPTTSASKWTVKGTTHCLISNACVAAGAKDSTGCNSCQPTVNKYAYSPVPGVCSINKKCYAKGAKHSGGCAECDPTTSASKWTVKGATHCLISDKCYAKGKADTSGCASCAPASNKYDWTAKKGMCKISGKCYADGTAHSGGCGKCVAATSPSAWTVTSTTMCLINDVCYKAGATMGCLKCDPTKSQTAWTPVSGCTNMNMDVGTHKTVYSSAHTRGFYFTSPVNFTITGVRVPTVLGTGVQNVQILKLPSKPPAYSSSTTTHTTLLYSKGVSGTKYISCTIPIKKGDIIGILGGRGTSTLKNSYGTGGYSSKILGKAVTLTRFIAQYSINTKKAGAVSGGASGTGSIGRVEVRYGP